MDVTKLADELLPKVLRAAQIVKELCGPLDSDLSYYQALYPDAAGPEFINMRIHSIEDLSTKIMQLTGYDNNNLDDLRQDAFDAYLEECDHQLDVLAGRIQDAKIEVKEPVARRTRFQTAPSHLTVIKPEDTSIYEPSVHPYADLIKNLSYGKYCRVEGEVKMYLELNATPLHWIDTEASLDKMIESLRKTSIIAVDLEHHSMHSYHGITCLMQISTDMDDYLIDTIKLRSSIPRLSCIISNPDILKVMHGAEGDNNWLQRDFNLFIVNLFDTYYAAKTLGYDRFSFAYLAEKIVDLYIDKAHQMSDWRVRPLPDDMKLYARQDTHYLIYIYEKLKRELMAKSKDSLLKVFNASAYQCLKLFKVEHSGPNDWKSVISGSNVPLSKTELERVRMIYKWRDEIARKEDVSLFALMPNPLIIRLSQSNIDVDQVLKKARYPVDLIVKNIDSLKEVLSKAINVPQKSTIPKEPAVKPEHIIFKDSDEEGPTEETQPKKSKITIATELYPRKKGGSLAGVFGAMQSSIPVLDAAPVLASMDVFKSTKAAEMLAQMDLPDVAKEEPEAQPDLPKDKEAVIMKSGIAITETEILSKATETFKLSLSSKKSGNAQPIQAFDYTTASLPQRTEQRESKSVPSKQFKPTIESIEIPKSNIGPRIPTQPRSGNKSQTFYK